MPKLPNYPLCFEPIFKERLWGGRRLETLGKILPAGKRIGESWEISDHASDQSVVANGPLRGMTLHELVGRFGTQLGLGSFGANSLNSSFPLLIKWIDACETLSVQVHPSDGHPRLPPGERGKTECWFIVEVEQGAEIYLGLRRGVDRAMLEHELVRGTADRCLNRFTARPGDFFFVPAGTVHAIGAGVLLAEIQQSSDTTFRLFDWNRVDRATGRPRELHLHQALDSIDFAADAAAPLHWGADSPNDRVALLMPDRCSYFSVEARRIRERATLDSGVCQIAICIGGRGKFESEEGEVSFCRGTSLLLPASAQVHCVPDLAVELLLARVA